VGLMSRVRWLLAGALALVAFVASVQALRTYVAHQMTVGVLALGALAVTLAVGLGSLGWARRRIERELRGLRGGAGSELLDARRKRLQAIRTSGTAPDRDALADATSAEEAGRAYIGRYLVATTVLMGLVGTFAGLMETLGKIAPLLGEKEAGALSLLAAPLAGLHVTFGASLVAILATLALALAQGDLTLHEELALALLEDRTTHELIPALWPPSDDAAERTVRAVGELKATLAEALARALEKSGKKIAENARAESERAARALETTAASVGKELGRLGETVTATAAEAARRQSEALVEASAGATRAAVSASEAATARAAALVEEAARRASAASLEAVERTTRATEEAARASTAALSKALDPLFAAEASRLEAVRGALAGVATEVRDTAARLTALDETLATHGRQHLESLDRASSAVLASFDRAVLGGGAALDGAATTLAAAARDLNAGAEALGPRIAALTTELGALGREVALLAARDPEGELGAVVLAELERLGAGVDRLGDLLRLAETLPPLPAPAAAAEES
jgi:hypothetical protein